MDSQQSTSINLYHHSVSSADAITKHLLLIQSSLQEIGVACSIFAHHVPPELQTQVNTFSKKKMQNTPLMWHHSQGNTKLNEVLELNCPKALVYHNITPAPFLAHDPYLEKLSLLGRQQLSQLQEAVDRSFSVSRYNAKELTELGFENISPFPILDMAPLSKPSENKPSTNSKTKTLLFVGKLCPHKNQTQLIEVLSYLKSLLASPVRLVLVGRAHPIYRVHIKQQIHRLGLEKEVSLLGAISEKALIEQYQNADWFVCLSQHEGFCLPIIEAMKQGLPVISYVHTALADTLGSSGVQLHTQDSKKIASILAALLKDPMTKKQVLPPQWDHVQSLSQFQNRKTIQQLCLELLQNHEPKPFTTTPRPI